MCSSSTDSFNTEPVVKVQVRVLVILTFSIGYSAAVGRVMVAVRSSDCVTAEAISVSLQTARGQGSSTNRLQGPISIKA